MLEPKQETGATDSHVQSFVVRYDYPRSEEHTSELQSTP